MFLHVKLTAEIVSGCTEEFNNALLTPELSASQLAELHKQLSDLYRMYIDPASVDCIRLADDIIAQLKTSTIYCS